MVIWILIVLMIIGVIIVGYDINNHVKKLEYKCKNCWPVTFKLTEDGCLVYSVNGKLWTEILKYSENNGIPRLDYMKFNTYNSDYKNFTSTISTMQNCHLWNKREFDKYRVGFEKYLMNNK